MPEDFSSKPITKEIAQKLLSFKGEVKGLLLRYDGDYVLKEKGESGLKKVERELEELGCPLKYREIKNLDFYPVGYRAISLLAIKKAFNFNDEKVREIGAFHPKAPLAIRLSIRLYSLSNVASNMAKVIKKTENIWEKHYTVGKVVFTEFNEKEKYGILELSDFNLHPIICRAMEGHVASLGKIILNASEVNCREIKCTFEGHDCHQFKITWK